jgi:uncharacterized repeat protein (TIGR02543 family)
MTDSISRGGTLRTFARIGVAMSLMLAACNITTEPLQAPAPSGPATPQPSIGLDDAPEAPEVASVTYSAPVGETVAAGRYAFLLHTKSGFSVTDLGEPISASPKTYGPFPTNGRVMAVEYDEEQNLVYLADASGALSLMTLANVERVDTVAQAFVPELRAAAAGDAGSTSGSLSLPGDTGAGAEVHLARVGNRVFALSGSTLRSFAMTRGAAGYSLVPEKPTQLPSAASAPERQPAHLAAGAGTLFLGFKNGDIEAWTPSTTGVFARASTSSMGGTLKAVMVRGSKLIAMSNGVGMQVIDYYRPAAPSVVYQSGEVKDVASAKLFGRTLLVGLDRNYVSTLDVSRFDQPKAVTTNKGALPTQMAIVGGNVMTGDQNKGSVRGIPPVLAGRVPDLVTTSFPLSGQVPVTFSKKIDPASVDGSSVTLACNGQAVTGRPYVTPDNLTVRFQPARSLPAQAKCTLDVSLVRGPDGQKVAAGSNGSTYTFTTAPTVTAQPPANIGSAYKHVPDGKFTDCFGAADAGAVAANPDAGAVTEPTPNGDSGAVTRGDASATPLAEAGADKLPVYVPRAGSAADAGAAAAAGACEWYDVKPAKGMYTYFYADFDGTDLHLLNDWFYNGENIDPDCYNQFSAWTGGGTERWEIRAYGDQHVEVTKNGVALDTSNSTEVTGGASYGPSPNVAEPHTIYELKIRASAGTWGVNLHDPGPTFACKHLEGDTTPLQGSVVAQKPGNTITTTAAIAAPVAPTLVSPANADVNVAIDPTLTWIDTNALGSYVRYDVQLANDASFNRVLLRTTTGLKALTVPRGYLTAATTYYWKVLATNQVGSAASTVSSFTTTSSPLYTFSVVSTGGGGVTASDASIDCSNTTRTCQTSKQNGTTITLTATPINGWVFTGWAGACKGTSPQITVTLQSDQYCWAQFTAPNGSSTLWVSKNGNGTGTVTSADGAVNCGAYCSDVVPNGTTVALQAMPAPGSVFAGWSGDCAGLSTAAVTLSAADKYCTATFNRVQPVSSQYTLTVATSGSGRVTSSPAGIDCPGTTCSASYSTSSAVTLTATADQGYLFTGWSGDCSGTSATTTVVVSATRYCVATFVSQTPTLTVINAGGGSVTSAPVGISCGATCSAQFALNSTVTLTATPDATHTFAGWSGSCTGTARTATVVMSVARACYATFQTNTLTVAVTGAGSVTSVPDGTINCSNTGGTCSQTYATAATVTLTATPAASYVFTGWSGSCTGTAATTTVTVTGAATCIANFSTNTLTVIVSPASGGTVTSDVGSINCSTAGGTGCTANLATQQVVVLTATAASGYTFTGWSGSCTGTAATATVTMNGARTCTASFTTNTLAVYVSPSGAGTVTSDVGGISCTTSAGGTGCSANFALNQQVVLTATATGGYVFSSWSGGCTGATATTTVTMNGSKSCYANFTTNTLTVYVSPAAGGLVTSDKGWISCSSSGAGCSANIATYGDVVTLTAAPASGYVFAGWSGSCTGTALTATVTMSGSRSCTATFSTNTLTVYVNPAAGGSVASDVGGIACSSYGGAGCSANIAAYGQVVTLTATPSANYTFTNWSGNCSGTALTARVTMNGSQSCYANFATNTLTVYVSPAGGGTVTSMPDGISCTTYGGMGCSATYAVSQEVTLTATPSANYTFTGWSGACSAAGTSTTAIVSMTAAQTCTASFSTNTLTVTTASGSGTVTSDVGGISCADGGGTCQANYSTGAFVQLTATPTTGYTFTSWTGSGCSGTTPVVTVQMNASYTCYANFAAQQTLSVSFMTGGTVTSDVGPISCAGSSGTCSANYTYGTVVTLTATPAGGYAFTGWTGSCSGTNAMVSVTMNGPRTCYPTFTLATYPVTVSVTGRGTVVSNPSSIACGSVCSASWPAAQTVTLVAIPSSGETFQGWGGACDVGGVNPSWSFAMPAAAYDCTALFTAVGTSNLYSGTFTNGTYDSAQCTNWTTFRGSLSSGAVYSSVAIRGTEDTKGVVCAGDSANSICQALHAGTTLTNVSCGGMVWDVDNCLGTEIHAGGATGGACSCGGAGHYTARPCYATRGYQGSIGDSCGGGASPQVVEVECVPANLTVAISGNGTVSSAPSGITCPGDCSEAYANTTVVTLTAIPSTGNVFTKWSGDCSGIDNVTSVTASATPKTCTAEFAKASATYSGAFVANTAPSTQCTDWTTFKSSLTGTFTSVTLRGSLDVPGITCTGSTADTICQAIKNGTSVSATYCNSYYWSTMANCLGTFELSASTTSANACSCTTADNIHTVRPCTTGATMWGGIGNSCSTTSQTIAVDCQ